MIFGYLRSCNPSGSNHRIIEIKKDGIISFGRDESNTIVLNHGSISRNHCLIWSVQFDQESIPTVYLRDISLNGVFVNDTRLQKVYILCDGDRIKIGNGCEFQYYPEFSEYNEKMALSPILLSNNISLELDNWIIRQKMIGKGTFGYVFASQRKSDSKLCAVKVIKNKHTSAISFEARNLPQLNHPNIIRVYEAKVNNNMLYIFQELICGGDLFSYLAKNDCLCPLPEFEALVISFQIMNALHYLHENNVCHRDLKLDNILLEAPKPFSRVVLADFGIAKLINVSTVNASSKRMFTIVGTVEYSAPEIGFSHGPDGYDLKCDIWSMGIIIHIMLSGISPFFKDGQHRNIIESAKSGLLNFATREWHNISQHAQSFVQSLLYVDINKRSDINDCFDHSWIKSHQAELSLVYKKILNC